MPQPAGEGRFRAESDHAEALACPYFRIAIILNNRRLSFVCVGPQRTATSWLHKHLLTHPRLAFPQHVKETMFFDERFAKGTDWYWKHFDPAQLNRKLGEVASTYFDSSDARERLASMKVPQIIINVRNPLERTYSLFCHHRVKGRVPDDFFDAIKVMPRIETSGRYAIHCEQWERSFGKDRCHYLFQAEVEAAPQRVIDEVCNFLGVNTIALEADATQRFGQLTRPRWPIVAKTAATLSTAMRSRGLHYPAELAKRMGLKSLVFGKPAGKEAIPEKVRGYLEELHAEDLTYLQTRFGDKARF